MTSHGTAIGKWPRADEPRSARSLVHLGLNPGVEEPTTHRRGVVEAPTVSIPVLICEEVTGGIGDRNPRRGRRFADQNELLERYRA
jgi:hypothetical protein